MKKLTVLGVVVAAAVLCAAPLSLHWSPAKTLSLSVDTASARIGRPLTPMSVAGVNRRVNRRAYYGAAAAGAAGYGYYNTQIWPAVEKDLHKNGGQAEAYPRTVDPFSCAPRYDNHQPARTLPTTHYQEAVRRTAWRRPSSRASGLDACPVTWPRPVRYEHRRH